VVDEHKAGLPKTNAARLLDEAGVAYDLAAYEVEMSEFSAERVAAELGVEPDQVFKTLVVEGDRSGPMFAVVPGGAELDLKALAAASDNRRAAMVPVAEVQKLTGYVRGGVTVLGARRAFPVYVDEIALLHERIGVSAGAKGLQLFLDPGDYIELTGAVVADIAR
jgi:Cys-tRNA(Pro)/Cys-tRNA(Cys) deacylase